MLEGRRRGRGIEWKHAMNLCLSQFGAPREIICLDVKLFCFRVCEAFVSLLLLGGRWENDRFIN